MVTRNLCANKGPKERLLVIAATSPVSWAPSGIQLPASQNLKWWTLQKDQAGVVEDHLKRLRPMQDEMLVRAKCSSPGWSPHLQVHGGGREGVCTQHSSMSESLVTSLPKRAKNSRNFSWLKAHQEVQDLLLKLEVHRWHLILKGCPTRGLLGGSRHTRPGSDRRCPWHLGNSRPVLWHGFRDYAPQALGSFINCNSMRKISIELT